MFDNLLSGSKTDPDPKLKYSILRITLEAVLAARFFMRNACRAIQDSLEQEASTQAMRLAADTAPPISSR
jgi:hypothetical protein